MSVKNYTFSPIGNWILSRPNDEITSSAKLCYARLVQYAGDEHRCFPKIATLAKEIGIQPRQARTLLAELRELRLVSVTSRKAEGKSSVYTILPHAWMPESLLAEWGTLGVGAPLPEGVGSLLPEGRQSTAALGRDKEEEKKEGRDPGVAEASLLQQHLGLAALREGRQLRDLNKEMPIEVDNQLQQGGENDASSSALGEAQAAPVEEVATSEPSSAETSAAAPLDVRMQDAQSVAERYAAKSRAAREAQTNKARVREQCQANLASKGPKEMSKRKQVAKLQETWRKAMTARYPSLSFARWEGKEAGQALKLAEKYSGPVAEQALDYLVTNWDAIQQRLLKGKGTVPSLGLLLKCHDILVPEAQQWASLRGVQKEWRDWFDLHPGKYPPSELRARYDAVKSDLEKLGLT